MLTVTIGVVMVSDRSLLQARRMEYLDSVGAKVPHLFRVADGPNAGSALVDAECVCVPPVVTKTLTAANVLHSAASFGLVRHAREGVWPWHAVEPL